MKKILYIAPHSFPIKSSESICNSKVAHVLASCGYKIDVFACSDPSTYPEDSRIDSFLKDSPNMRIYTVRPSRNNFYSSASVITNLKCVPHNLKILFKTGYFYNGISTPFAILQAIEELIKREGFHYDVIITRGFHTDIIGISLKKKYGVKWIANWNDPFPLKRFPAPYGQGYDAKLPYFENRVYEAIQQYADIHTFPSDRLRNYMLKCFKNVSKENTRVIHHMAHSGLTQFFTKPKSDDGILKLVSCGSVGKPRKPEVFLKALAEALECFRDVQVKCYFVGYYDENLKLLVDTLSLDNIVEFVPPKNYSDCMSFISQCGMSLIIETTCEEGIYLPTKVVDAVQCELPIFCVSPRVGTLRDIVSGLRIGYASDIDNLIDIKENIINMLRDYKDAKLPMSNKELAPVFFEDYIASQYQELIDQN